MNIHEYQAQNLFKEFNIPVPLGKIVSNIDDIERTIQSLDREKICLKAQIHAGGRGKGHFLRSPDLSGVNIANSKHEAVDIARRMLGDILVTKQTGSTGRMVNSIYIVEPVDVAHEYYVAVTLDRTLRRPVMIFSRDGGVNIESSEKPLHKIIIDPLFGLLAYQVSPIVHSMGLDKQQTTELTQILLNLYKLFREKECLLVEINPLVVNKDGRFFAIDSKITFDDNASFRHADITDLRDIKEEDPKEVEAAKHNLNYIALDGTIACLVNGAGLAMATMDIIKHYGAEPANFLDFGGGAGEEQITRALEIILCDQAVTGILINVFGGIVQCDIVAQGIVAAAKKFQLTLPIVVRLEGTNCELGKRILSGSGLNIIPANDLDTAAKQIVALTKTGSQHNSINEIK